jgi:trypsin-like peptidase
MARAIVIATLLVAVPRALCAQALSVLHIKVVLADADGKATPVPRHALLVSDNPATATPRLIVTGADGTADVKLRPGNYTVESDKPVAFHGKAYQWTQTLDIKAGRDAVLELTAANAESEPVGAATGASAETDPWVLLPQWQDSVVALWTPVTRASGFVIDARGLVATSQRAIGTATSVEVQLTPAVKVAARVLEADRASDVAVLWIDPGVAQSVRPVPLGCTQTAMPAVAAGQEIFTIGMPLRQEKGVTPGTVSSADAHSIIADFRLARGSEGGPVFTAAGGVVGITSILDAKGESRRGADSRVVPAADVCRVVASAEKKMESAARPSGTHLPVEPAWPLPADAFKDAALHRAGGLAPYQLASSAFDVAFITPLLTYATQYQAEQASGRAGGGGTRMPAPGSTLVRPLADFLNWSDYVDDYPPVLLVRITPKMVEGFWTSVARGAAQTQGVAIPSIKHFKAGFARMRALCDDIEVAPIHPFMLEHRTSESDTIYEGLYAYDPGALGPQCSTVKLELYSEKEPQKGETRVVDPRLLQQISQDFAPYQAPKNP